MHQSKMTLPSVTVAAPTLHVPLMLGEALRFKALGGIGWQNDISLMRSSFKEKTVTPLVSEQVGYCDPNWKAILFSVGATFKSHRHKPCFSKTP